MTAPLSDEARQAVTWQAWKLGEHLVNDALPIDAETLDEAVAQAMQRCPNRGDRFAVQWTHHGRGKRTLWLFNVKHSAKHCDWRPAADGGRAVRVPRPFPELLLHTDLAADFAPTLRFDAFRDDAVGVDRQLIEGKCR